MWGQLGSFWNKLKPKYDDDTIDRLNYIYTNIIILAFALSVAAKQYVGEPLQCWVPAQFKVSWFLQLIYWTKFYCTVLNRFLNFFRNVNHSLVEIILALIVISGWMGAICWKLLLRGKYVLGTDALWVTQWCWGKESKRTDILPVGAVCSSNSSPTFLYTQNGVEHFQWTYW